MKLGAADFMTKPFETDALVKKIESLVAQAVPDIDEDGERRRADRRQERTIVAWGPTIRSLCIFSSMLR